MSALTDLIDCLRWRPVATTAAQMRAAAALLEVAHTLLMACEALNQLDGADKSLEELDEPDRSVVRNYRDAVRLFSEAVK